MVTKNAPPTALLTHVIPLTRAGGRSDPSHPNYPTLGLHKANMGTEGSLPEAKLTEAFWNVQQTEKTCFPGPGHMKKAGRSDTGDEPHPELRWCLCSQPAPQPTGPHTPTWPHILAFSL